MCLYLTMKNHNNQKTKIKAKLKISNIVNFIFIILVAICIPLELYILQLERIVQQLENKNDELLTIADRLNNSNVILSDRIEKAIIKNDNFIDLKNNISKISKEVSIIKNDYVINKEIQDQLSFLEEFYNSIDYQDFSIQTNNSIKQTNDAISNNTVSINDLNNTKEDLYNKVNSIEDNTPDDKYLTTIGFSEEILKLFDRLYPIGSIYCTVGNELPPVGEWTLLPNNRVLWSDSTGAGNLLDPTLPNVKGDAGSNIRGYPTTGPFSYTTSNANQISNGTKYNLYKMTMNFHNVNTIYQDNATVRPPSITTKMYKRTG